MDDTSAYLEFIWAKLKLSKKSPTPGQPYNHAYTPLNQYCLLPEWHALFNQWGQNPCEVARTLIDVCYTNSYYDLPVLHYQDRYPVPSSTQASDCICNLPVYNLLQACGGCQQVNLTKSIPWNDFTGNCDKTSHAYPLTIPSTTLIPDWAWQDSTLGALDLGYLMMMYNHSQAAQPVSAATSLTTSTLSSTSTVPSSNSPSTAATAAATPSATSPPAASDAHTGTHPQGPPSSKIGTTVALVVALVLGLGIAVLLFLYFRRKRRTRRQGTRLGSSADLPGSKFDEMSEKRSSTAPTLIKPDDISIFVPTETFVSSRASTSSHTSFATNSSSSQSHEFRAYMRETAATAPSFTTYTSTSRSSVISGSTASDASLSFDDSLSPFADAHRAPSILSLDSHLSIPANLHIPATRVVVPRDNVRDSLATTISVPMSVQSLSRMDTASLAPSSTGAVYGREGDDESEDGSVRGSDAASVRRRRSQEL